jgi:hypothetical protein
MQDALVRDPSLVHDARELFLTLSFVHFAQDTVSHHCGLAGWFVSRLLLMPH